MHPDAEKYTGAENHPTTTFENYFLATKATRLFLASIAEIEGLKVRVERRQPIKSEDRISYQTGSDLKCMSIQVHALEEGIQSCIATVDKDAAERGGWQDREIFAKLVEKIEAFKKLMLLQTQIKTIGVL